jgi:hypothetical protein
VNAVALPHGIDLAGGKRAHRMEVVGPGPARHVVDRNPEMAPDRIIAERRDHREGRHHPLGDAPVVAVVLGIAAHPDIEAACALHDFENRPCVGKNVMATFRVGIEVATVQERHVA